MGYGDSAREGLCIVAEYARAEAKKSNGTDTRKLTDRLTISTSVDTHVNRVNAAESERGWEVVRRRKHRKRARVNDQSTGVSESAIADKARDLTEVVALFPRASAQAREVNASQANTCTDTRGASARNGSHAKKTERRGDRRYWRGPSQTTQ